MIPLTTAFLEPPGDLTIYYARDSLLENLPVLVFYGPSTTINSTFNSSRIQAHIVTLGGASCFPRLTISPSSPLYAAVNHLPVELQGDEVSRGLAVSLLTYFAALSADKKRVLSELAASRRPNGLAPPMFDEMHAGDLAAALQPLDDDSVIAKYLRTALSARSISWLDIDVILPNQTISRVMSADGTEKTQLYDENGNPIFQYGRFDNVVQSFGSHAFLPTSKLRRAPSRPPQHGKNQFLSKDAKIALRREMCELVDTEGNYISKLNELVREKATLCEHAGASIDLKRLFPESLNEILDLSLGFYKDIQSILDQTEDEAIVDIEATNRNDQPLARRKTPNEAMDPTGATMLAKALTRWLPKFHNCYQDYLRASSEFGDIISSCSNDVFSISAKTLRDIGEQRLRSTLIEPVQRLPRYNLIIDNIVNLLPIGHTSYANFLKARDVIKDICALDAATDAHISQASRVLKELVGDWSQYTAMKGRLLTAADVSEISPPFYLPPSDSQGILLLFTDGLILLRRTGESALTARGLVAEIDRLGNSTQTHRDPSLEIGRALQLSASFKHLDAQITESNDGQILHISGTAIVGQQEAYEQSRQQAVLKTIYLHGAYEKKATRLCQDTCLARIEDRFEESIRDNGHWALRTVTNPEGLSLFAAFLEIDGSCTSQLKAGQAPVRVFLADSVPESSVGVDKSRDEKGLAIDIVGKGGSRYQISTIFGGTLVTRVDCSSEKVFPTVIQQLECNYRLLYQHLVNYDITFMGQILRDIPIKGRSKDGSQRGFRPMSPVKMFSKMLGGPISQMGTPSKPSHDAKLTKKAPHSLETPMVDSSAHFLSAHQGKESDSRVTVVQAEQAAYPNPLVLLEDTLIAYLVGLRAQSGNVVGKILRNRATANELAVNDIYNMLLEDPTRINLAAEASVDVLFSAFEMFLRRAWRERMGPLISPSALRRMQSVLDSADYSTFAQEFKTIVTELTPQNRRAFASIIKLLSDLLEASSNDGDRGVLIASFSEALVLVGNPHDFITLLDRLIDDYENLFEDAIERAESSGSAASSISRNRSFNKGSYSSNNSSFRKRFGLGGNLSRENSKIDSESKVASILRSWGKTSKNPIEVQNDANSTSKILLVRSRSTDMNPRLHSSLPSISQERPINSEFGDLAEVKPLARDKIVKLNQERNVPNKSLQTPTTSPRKKRRSSLSDLTQIQGPGGLDGRSPLQSRNMNVGDRPTTRKSHMGPRGSPYSRENSPPKDVATSYLQAPVPSLNQMPTEKRALKDPPAATSRSQNRNLLGLSANPTGKLSASLEVSGRKLGGESAGKFRIQSPQKIRERLNHEQTAFSDFSKNLQDEIDGIGRQMTAFKLHAPSSSLGNRDGHGVPALSARLDALAEKLQAVTKSQAAAAENLARDLDTSLVVANSRALKLEQLYKEANSENEMLYERFNDELGKVLGKVKRGEGLEEMRTQLSGALKEVGSLRSERARLKKEMAALQSRVVE